MTRHKFPVVEKGLVQKLRIAELMGTVNFLSAQEREGCRTCCHARQPPAGRHLYCTKLRTEVMYGAICDYYERDTERAIPLRVRAQPRTRKDKA